MGITVSNPPGATVTGVLTPGNLALLTATGIIDSGVAPLTSFTGPGLWGSNTVGSGATPSILTAFLMPLGTAALPTYSLTGDANTGMWSSGADLLDFSTGGNKILELYSISSATIFAQLFANSNVTLRAQGAGNPAFIVAGNGTGGVWLMANGGASSNYVGQFNSGGSAGLSVNYPVFSGAVSGANVKLGTNAENLVFGSGSALATSATAGMTLFQACAGTPSGAPTGAGAGAVPFIYDTSANKLWFYNGSWRGVVVA